ncbi:MAG: hypothetical protein HY840_06815 [Bacteroidetes bacterium]|nr:hypothetical protein [Bacteroidota bacterium]
MQNILNRLKVSFLLPYFVILLLFAGCGNQDEKNKELEVKIDSSASTLVKFNNTLFSVPSPYQLAFLVKEQKVDYNKEYLNPTSNTNKYTTDFKKALNLGIYGANLGYINIYEQNPDAINYFAVIKGLATQLNIIGAFNPKTISRIEKNMSNKDSLLFILSGTYRNADQYLKDNKRDDAGVLILAGGWVEGVHILTQIAGKQKNQEIINRIGEQKHPLDNLIKIMSPYYNQSEDFSKLIDSLIDLAYDFDGIDFKYKYEEPAVDVENKISTINGKTEVIMSNDQLKTISEKITKIRKSIVG